MTLSDFSIKRPVFAWILMFGLIFFGALSFQGMGINENPDVEFPVISISYNYEGASPEVVEKDVIEVVESVLVSMQGIRKMISNAQRGSASITLEFDLDVDINFALQEVNSLIARAQRQLPDQLDPPVVTKSNADDQPIMYLALRTEVLSFRELMLLFRDSIQDRLSTVDGVAEVRAFGYHEPVMRVDLRAQDLARYQLTAQDIVASLTREHKELPAGKFEDAQQEQLVRMMGEVSTVTEFKNLTISRRGGAPNFQLQKLTDVANIYEGTEDVRRISRVNGTQALGIAIAKQRGVNAVATAQKVKGRIDSINKNLPAGVDLSVNLDLTQFIEESVRELIFTLILSALLTSLVCWMFIGSFSASTNILLAIPTAIVGTFIFINWLGFTLNTFSLLGLALAIGVVVDDAIVMLENILRYMQLGYSRVKAAFVGAREITFAVIATSVALIAIFVPITFLGGIEGRFFFEFAVTISIAVALSSLEALTLAPMRCSQFLSISPRSTRLGLFFEAQLKVWTEFYRKTLTAALQRKRMVSLGSLVLFVLSLGIVRAIPTELAPPQDRGVLFCIFIAPDGASLQYTSERVRQFEDIARKHPAVARTFVAVGGFGQGGQANRGNGVVILKPRDERSQTQFEVASELREQTKDLDGLKVVLRDRFGGALGGRRGSSLEFTIQGPDPSVQREVFAKIKKKMDDSGKILGARSDDVTTLPEIHLQPNRRRAQSTGVEIEEIATAINASLGGVRPIQYTQGGRRFDVLVELQESDRQTQDTLRRLQVRNNRGEFVPLLDVVDIVATQGPQTIYREDRARGLRVDADLAPGVALGDVVPMIRDWGRDLLPKDYQFYFEDTPQSKGREALIVMLLGLLIAYMVLAAQFNSFIDPVIVFLAVPFGITGSLLGLLIGGQSLNVYSVIGILLTMGIVKKNSILLVEFTNQLRDDGQELVAAVVDAGVIRLRPILMTNFATLAAAIPPALALGPGAETRVPMALTVLGGVSLSLVMTLYVVPCVYSWVAPRRLQILEEDETPGSAVSVVSL